MTIKATLACFSLFLLFSCKPEFTGQSMGEFQYAGPPPDNKLFFSKLTNGFLTAAPIIEKDKLLMFFSTRNGTVAAFDYRKATDKWINQYPSEITSAPILRENLLYFGKKDGELVCLEADSGKELWKFRANDAIITSPVVDESGVYFSSADKNFYALDPETGAEKWRKTLSSEMKNQPLVYHNNIYLTDSSGNLFVLDRQTAEEKWIYQAEGKITTSLVASAGVIYFADQNKNFYALNSKSPELIWKITLPGVSFATPSISANRKKIYLAVGDRVLFLNLQDGSYFSEIQLNGEVNNSLINIGGYLYVTDNSGKLYAIDETNRQLRWQHQGAGEKTTSPYLFNGIVHYGTDQEVIYALGREEDVHIYSTMNQKTEETLRNRRGYTQFRMAYHVPSGTRPGNSLKRVYQLNDQVSSSFAHGNDFLYLGAGNSFYSLRTDSNEIRWEKLTPGKNNSAPAFANRNVIFANTEGKVYSLTPENKDNPLWVYQTGGEIHSHPFIYNDWVYVGADDGYLYSLDIRGNLVWKFKIGAKMRTMPVVLNNIVYFGAENGNFYAVSALTGLEIWKFASGKRINTTPAIQKEKVYFANDAGSFYSLSASDGRVLWQFQSKGSINTDPAISEGKVVFAADKNIYALNSDSGKIVWQFKTNAIAFSSPTIVDNSVYIGSDEKLLYCLNLENGEKKWDFRSEEEIKYAPLVINGTVYVGSGKKVYALQ